MSWVLQRSEKTSAIKTPIIEQKQKQKAARQYPLTAKWPAIAAFLGFGLRQKKLE